MRLTYLLTPIKIFWPAVSAKTDDRPRNCGDSSLHMDRQVVDAFGGFHYRFRDGRVGVDNAAEFVCGGLKGHGDAGFGEKFGRVRADDVDAEDLVVFLFGDDLDKAVSLAEDACFARC